jgi:IclR family mhp operon transcriptional activator
MRSGNSYRRVQGLVRGLAVLCAMNEAPAAAGTATEIAGSTGLHRTTVKRLLETLCEAGFLRRLPDDSYCLTFRVRNLSDGFTDEGWVSQIAGPLLRKLTEQVLWPSDLVALEGDELMVRDSTHSFSPLSFHPAMVGHRLPFLTTAAGRAYLAFCAPGEREALLEMLRARSDGDGQRARDSRQLRSMLQATRARGYSVNEGDWIGGGKFGAIAVPILQHGHARACINLIFSKRAVSTAEAAKRYLGFMRDTASEIERQFGAVRG